jgi:poly(3-hydroxybutyrate) depolymerase
VSLVLTIVNAWRPSLSRLQEVEDFGTNPGALRMLTYLPNNLSPRPALVVVLHGSMQSAANYDRGAGWSTLLCSADARAESQKQSEPLVQLVPAQ